MIPDDTSQSAFPIRFHRYYQLELTALFDQINNLSNTSTINGERGDAVDHALAGIARLNQEVSEASRHLPAYDQRTYGEGIKALSERLAKVRSEFAPRPKFTFKQALKRRQDSAASVVSARRAEVDGGDGDAPAATAATAASAKTKAEAEEEESDNAADVANILVRDASNKSAIVHRPEYESARSYIVVKQKDVYIVVQPPTRGRDGRAARILDVEASIVDLRGASANSGQIGDVAHPLATLTIKNVKGSVLVCGRVGGAVHVTGLRNSVLVASCRQMRMHECVNVRVYLHCASRPIIEACQGVGFAPMPNALVDHDSKIVENQWSEVDDFNWLKAEASPNWHKIEEKDRLAGQAWEKLADPIDHEALVSGTLKSFNLVEDTS